VRFDVAYKDGFRCNIRSIRHDYPALHRWLRMLYWGENDSFRKWSNFKHVVSFKYVWLIWRSRKAITLVH